MPSIAVQSSDIKLPNGFTRRQIASCITPRAQELILLPTEKCNFRCTYCYEDFELGKMSETTQVAIERFLSRRIPELDRLSFSWFGGEPLIAKDVVLRLSRFAKELCDKYGTTFKGGLTTNAYVLDERLARSLIELRQNFFQITLDGWQEGHDERRKRADGAGTFSTIWGNLLALRSIPYQFECCVRVHVRRDNFDNLVKLMEAFAREFKGDTRFYLDFQHLRDMGGAGGQTVENPVTLDELPQFESKLRKHYKATLNTTLGWPQNDIDENVLVKAANAGESAGSQRASEQVAGAPYVCYAAKANSLLIRSNGRVGKCTVAFHDDRNDIGYLDDDGTVKVDNEKLAPWIRGLGTLDLIDVGCPIKTMPKASAPQPVPVQFFQKKQLQPVVS